MSPVAARLNKSYPLAHVQEFNPGTGLASLGSVPFRDVIERYGDDIQFVHIGAHSSLQVSLVVLHIVEHTTRDPRSSLISEDL